MPAPTSAEVLARMGDAPGALVGDYFVCRSLARNAGALRRLAAAGSDTPMSVIVPVDLATIKAETYLCGEYHGDCPH